MGSTAVLIAAASGRALAVSARRGGYLPLVVDFFGDQDTLAAAQAHVRLGGGLRHGVTELELMEAFESLAAAYSPCGAVCGTGFEDRPHVLAAVARRWRVYGNGAEAIAAVKDPARLAALCRDFAIPHPPTSMSLPAVSAGWLAKRRGGAGGTHVAAASEAKSGDGIYFQLRVPGMPVSALLLCGRHGADVVGFSAQWSAPTARHPYRYGGAVRPASIAPRVAGRLAEAASRIAAALSLMGLTSVDFLVDGNDFWLLEVNPRPGATLDIFEPDAGSLFALHMAACSGKPTAGPSYPDGAKAAAIVYADQDVFTPAQFEWPEWTVDRPNGRVAIKAGEPLCTVHAGATTAVEAKALADERVAMVQAWAHKNMGAHENVVNE